MAVLAGDGGDGGARRARAPRDRIFSRGLGLLGRDAADHASDGLRTTAVRSRVQRGSGRRAPVQCQLGACFKVQSFVLVDAREHKP